MNYPVSLDLDAPLKVARWRVIANPIMAIPHFIVLYVMMIVLEVLQVVSWFAILFTGNIPRGMFNFMAAILRYQWRVGTFYLWMREPYPAFDFTASDVDTGNDPASFSINYPAKLSRGLIFVKWLLVIPHMIVLTILGIGAGVAIVVSWFAVLITGSYPQGLRNFVIGFFRWSTRVNIYYGLMSDVYPPFSLQP